LHSFLSPTHKGHGVATAFSPAKGREGYASSGLIDLLAFKSAFVKEVSHQAI